MLRRMNSARTIKLLAASALSASLAACAMTPAVHEVRPSPETAAGSRDLGDASVYGLYLAGEAAIDRGSSKEAAFYFARASEADAASIPIRTRAFTAALVAGEVS